MGDAARIAFASLRTLAGALRGERLRLRAMALTYLSLFALVPALVVAFSVMQAFGATEALWRGVHEYLVANLAVGARASIEPYLDRFVRNAHAASAGVVGGAFLVYSAVGLFGEVERAVNEIWTVRRLRPLRQRALIYWTGLTLGPVLLAGSLALGHSVGTLVPQGQLGGAFARGAGVLLSCLLFAALYLLVPATRVRWQAAAAGGLVAGISWELAKALYTFVVAHFFRYHAIYGSVAAVPIFLVWLYLSWTLVLFGARVSFVVQHAGLLLRGHAPAGEGTVGRELLAASAMLEVALAYHQQAPPPDPGEVALRLQTFGEPVREVLGVLRAQRLVIEVAGGGLVPARPLEQITLADVRAAVSGAPPPELDGPAGAVSGMLAAAERAAAEALADRSYADLCARTARAPLRTLGEADERAR